MKYIVSMHCTCFVKVAVEASSDFAARAEAEAILDTDPHAVQVEEHTLEFDCVESVRPIEQETA